MLSNAAISRQRAQLLSIFHIKTKGMKTRLPKGTGPLASKFGRIKFQPSDAAGAFWFSPK
ncbi:hypothetical protein [Nitrososphaera sp. AFS]|uniref:hypothetical protein n=1 Tax=Nitrososphaera sp. AFS TaxID=2301191 RepID=UPI0013924241|nr:hypothetical protein [Nitrososphaera sp. AFS]NAL77468.1 hypothetical protein [Nitrososphaera sp. AFS]